MLGRREGAAANESPVDVFAGSCSTVSRCCPELLSRHSSKSMDDGAARCSRGKRTIYDFAVAPGGQCCKHQHQHGKNKAGPRGAFVQRRDLLCVLDTHEVCACVLWRRREGGESLEDDLCAFDRFRHFGHCIRRVCWCEDVDGARPPGHAIMDAALADRPGPSRT